MRVLISGAGVAGPTLAWFLAKMSARITVVEKFPSIRPGGQNIDVQGSAITVMKKMGLMDEVRRYNTTEKGTQFIDPKGRPFALFPLKKGAVSLTNENEILREDLAGLLYRATKDHPNVDYLFSTTIKEVVSNDDEAVKVGLSNGEVHEYDFAVAADGQWSRLRKMCFPPESVTVKDMDMYVAYCTIPRLPSDNDWWNVYWGLGSRIVSLRPDPHGTIRAMFMSMPCSDAQRQAWVNASRGGRQVQEELVRKDFADAGWQTQRLLDAMDDDPDFYLHPIQQIKMSKWSKSRVICLGDAAYAPTPLTGSGTPLAIIGAYILAGELNKLADREHPSTAFDAFEDTYRPFVDKTQELSSFLPGIAFPETAWRRWLFLLFMSALNKVVTMVWVGRRLMPEEAEADNDGFELPQYPSLDEKIAK